jgi:hypothetical protein
MSLARGLTVRPFTEEDRGKVIALVPRLAIGVARWRDPRAVVAAALEWVAESMAEARRRIGRCSSLNRIGALSAL